MKLKKLIAGLSAAVAASCMAVSAFAADGEYEAFLMCADNTWCWGDSATGNWNTVSSGEGYGTDATITGDGTYTVSCSSEQVGSTISGYCFQVFNVDIVGFAEGEGVGKGAEGYDDLTTSAEKMQFVKDAGINITDVSIIVDGSSVYDFADEDVLFADIEGNGNLRIELYNTQGESVKGGSYTAPADWIAIAEDLEFNEIAVQFTVSGLGGGDAAAEEETPAEDTTTEETPAEDTETEQTPADDGASTGLGAIALAGLALSGAAAVATKKRK